MRPGNAAFVEEESTRNAGTLLIPGYSSTVATAKIHVGRRFLQRHDGGGGNQTHDDVVKFKKRDCMPCAINTAGPGFRPARRVGGFAAWNRARIRRCHRMS